MSRNTDYQDFPAIERFLSQRIVGWHRGISDVAHAALLHLGAEQGQDLRAELEQRQEHYDKRQDARIRWMSAGGAYLGLAAYALLLTKPDLPLDATTAAAAAVYFSPAAMMAGYGALRGKHAQKNEDWLAQMHTQLRNKITELKTQGWDAGGILDYHAATGTLPQTQADLKSWQGTQQPRKAISLRKSVPPQPKM